MAKSPTAAAAAEKSAAPYKDEALYDVTFASKAEFKTVKFKAGARATVRGRLLNHVAGAVATAQEIVAQEIVTREEAAS